MGREIALTAEPGARMICRMVNRTIQLELACGGTVHQLNAARLDRPEGTRLGFFICPRVSIEIGQQVRHLPVPGSLSTTTLAETPRAFLFLRLAAKSREAGKLCAAARCLAIDLQLAAAFFNSRREPQ